MADTSRLKEQAIFFKSQNELRDWFEKNYKTEKELIVGYYKVSTKKPGITWSQSVDEALCFGWIDGIRRSIDEESYCNRFTPRNPKSNWSAINIKKVLELQKQGLMKPEGLELFEKRDLSKSEAYTYENKPVKLSKEFEDRFKYNDMAWKNFKSMAPSYKKTVTNWIMSAKRHETQLKRLHELIEDCEANRKIKQMRYGDNKS